MLKSGKVARKLSYNSWSILVNFIRSGPTEHNSFMWISACWKARAAQAAMTLYYHLSSTYTQLTLDILRIRVVLCIALKCGGAGEHLVAGELIQVETHYSKVARKTLFVDKFIAHSIFSDGEISICFQTRMIWIIGTLRNVGWWWTCHLGWELNLIV